MAESRQEETGQPKEAPCLHCNIVPHTVILSNDHTKLYCMCASCGAHLVKHVSDSLSVFVKENP